MSDYPLHLSNQGPNVAVTFPKPPRRPPPVAALPPTSVLSEEALSLHTFSTRPDADAFMGESVAFEMDARPSSVKRTGNDNRRKSSSHKSVGSSSQRFDQSEKSGKSSRSVTFQDSELQIEECSVQKIGGCGSFSFGLMLGLIPVLLIVRLCLGWFRKEKQKYQWHEHWVWFGETLGLFLLIGGAILVVLVNVESGPEDGRF